MCWQHIYFYLQFIIRLFWHFKDHTGIQRDGVNPKGVETTLGAAVSLAALFAWPSSSESSLCFFSSSFTLRIDSLRDWKYLLNWARSLGLCCINVLIWIWMMCFSICFSSLDDFSSVFFCFTIICDILSISSWGKKQSMTMKLEIISMYSILVILLIS